LYWIKKRRKELLHLFAIQYFPIRMNVQSSACVCDQALGWKWSWECPEENNSNSWWMPFKSMEVIGISFKFNVANTAYKKGVNWATRFRFR